MDLGRQLIASAPDNIQKMILKVLEKEKEKGILFLVIFPGPSPPAHPEFTIPLFFLIHAVSSS